MVRWPSWKITVFTNFYAELIFSNLVLKRHWKSTKKMKWKFWDVCGYHIHLMMKPMKYPKPKMTFSFERLLKVDRKWQHHFPTSYVHQRDTHNSCKNQHLTPRDPSYVILALSNNVELCSYERIASFEVVYKNHIITI